MAVTVTSAESRPRWPRPGGIDPARCSVSYDPPADELVVYFGGTLVPKYVNPIDAPEADDLGLMVGMNEDESSTGEVIGLHDDPAYLEALADFLAEAEELFDRYRTPPPPMDEQLARLPQADGSEAT